MSKGRGRGRGKGNGKGREWYGGIDAEGRYQGKGEEVEEDEEEEEEVMNLSSGSDTEGSESEAETSIQRDKFLEELGILIRCEGASLSDPDNVEWRMMKKKLELLVIKAKMEGHRQAEEILSQREKRR